MTPLSKNDVRKHSLVSERNKRNFHGY